MAEAAYQRFGLAEVWLMITPQNPEKDLQAVAFEHREKMCRLMAQDHEWLKVSRFEQEHKTANTYQTLQKLQQAHPAQKFVWIMGSDNLKTCYEWEGWDEIMQRVPLLVYSRHGYQGLEQSAPMVQAYAAHHKEDAAPLAPLPNWRLFPDPVHPASSTTVRADMQGANAPIDLDAKVAQYIAEHCLYSV